jgi:hypothetical protein
LRHLTLDGEDVIKNVLCLKAVDPLVVDLLQLVQQQLGGVLFMVNLNVRSRLSIIIIKMISCGASRRPGFPCEGIAGVGRTAAPTFATATSTPAPTASTSAPFAFVFDEGLLVAW